MIHGSSEVVEWNTSGLDYAQQALMIGIAWLASTANDVRSSNLSTIIADEASFSSKARL
jgi:hypothetical protein